MVATERVNSQQAQSGATTTGASSSSTAVVPAGSSNGSNDDDKKHGHKCCMFCCDMRRAVIIVDIVRIVLLVFGLITVRAVARATGLDENKTETTNEAGLPDSSNNGHYGGEDRRVMFVMYIIAAVICTIVGIVGAVKYHMYMVAIAVVPMALETLVLIFRLDIIFFTIITLFIYPHIMLIKEIRDGIMSEVNYVNVKHSCCCV